MIFLIIVFGIIFSLFLFHFIGIFIFKCHYKKVRYYEKKLINTKRFRIVASHTKNLMVSLYHKPAFDVDDDLYPYSREILIEYGGLYISFKYGHDFIPGDFVDSRVKYYGLYCIDNEIFWRCIWWGKHLYDNPFRRNKFIGIKYLNFDKNTLDSVDNLQYTKSSPYYITLTDTIYINKHNHEQHVSQIKFWIEERSWTWKLLYYLKFGELFAKRIVYLSFDTNTELGIQAGSWKGGVLGSGILLNKEKDLYKNYIRITRKYPHLVGVLKHEIINRINQFMTEDKSY